MVNENKKRVAKNTMMLYLRMLFYMAVSLYTSRVVLQTLGIEDFGIFNVVGGVLSMLGFLNASLTGSTSRFITFALGKNDYSLLRKTFAGNSNLHFGLAIFIVVIAETIGLWFLNTQLIIPENRIVAANWIYQASIISAFIGIAQMPYSSIIVAHEKMNIYAYMGILEVSLKLLIVYLLIISPFDKLISYSFLYASVSVLINFMYAFYCHKNFSECRHKLFWDREFYKELLTFSGWTLYSTLSWMFKGQGVNMLLNIFFGPVVNAARSIAFQVNSAVKSFISNFSTAFNPQITKLYAAGEYTELYQSIIQYSKISFLLLFFLTLPILMETQFILGLWLGIVPEYVVLFTRLVLIESLIEVLGTAMTYGISASGKIARYQILNGTVNLLNLPLSYLLLKLGFGASTVFIVSILTSLIILFVTMYYAKKSYNFPAGKYTREVLFRAFVIGGISVLIVLIALLNMPSSLGRFMIVGFTSVFIVCGTSFILMFNAEEKAFVIKMIKKRFC